MFVFYYFLTIIYSLLMNSDLRRNYNRLMLLDNGLTIYRTRDDTAIHIGRNGLLRISELYCYILVFADMGN